MTHTYFHRLSETALATSASAKSPNITACFVLGQSLIKLRTRVKSGWRELCTRCKAHIRTEQSLRRRPAGKLVWKVEWHLGGRCIHANRARVAHLPELLLLRRVLVGVIRSRGGEVARVEGRLQPRHKRRRKLPPPQASHVEAVGAAREGVRLEVGVGKYLGRRRPRIRLTREQSRDELLCSGGEDPLGGGEDRAAGEGRLVDLRRRLSGEGHRVEQQLVQDDAERPQVDGHAVPLAEEDLGRKHLGRAKQRARSAIADVAGEAEIDEKRIASAIDADVFKLHVAVRQACSVQAVECEGTTPEIEARAARTAWPASLKQRSEAPA
mmetsp:Transcript_45919/g.97955  ORF Transcript_45919/g.97955 Transcript_45919/m.97955 type:complete len:325 (+) Transcript_45919:29-1003(+)